MKHLSLILLFCGITLVSTSCHTELKGVQTVQSTRCIYPKPNMEFIGFNYVRQDYLFNGFGAMLERNKIAVDGQNLYSGIYSFEELTTYKSTMRYVSYINVVHQSYTKDDGVDDNLSMYIAGLYLSIFFLYPISIPLLCCANANKCEITLKGEYQLNVYDTQEKKIVFSQPVTIDVKDEYKGEYSHKKTNREDVNKRYRTILQNKLLEAYSQAYEFINNQ